MKKIIALTLLIMCLPAMGAVPAEWGNNISVEGITSSGNSYGLLPTALIDGSGMSEDGEVCVSNTNAGMWSGEDTGDPEAPGVGTWVEIDLGARYDVDGLRIWNYNEYYDGNAYDHRTTGIKYCNISVSADRINWTTVTADPNCLLTMAPGTTTYDTPDAIPFVGTPDCQFIKITCLENYGRNWFGNICGLSEIQVFGTANGNSTLGEEIKGISASSPNPDAGWGRLASKAVDGSGMTGFSHDNDPGNMWSEKSNLYAEMTLDLQAFYSVQNLAIWNYNENSGNPDVYTKRGIRSIEVSISSDMLTWTSLGNYTLTKADGSASYDNPDVINVTPTEGRYLRLIGTSNFGDPGYMGLSEVKVYGEPGTTVVEEPISGGISAVSPKPLWRDFQASNRLAQYAVNGDGLIGIEHSVDPHTMWLEQLTDSDGGTPIDPNNSVTDAVMTVDLGGITTLDKIRVWNYNELYFENRGISLAKFESSLDGINWSLVQESAPLTKGDGFDNYVFDDEFDLQQLVCRYFRITALDDFDDNLLTDGVIGLSEVQFWGERVVDPSAEVTNITATSEAAGYGRVAANLVSGDVLNGDSCRTWQDYMWVGSAPSGDVVTFEFDSLKDVSSVKVWNYNEVGHSDYGVKNFELQYTLDGYNWLDYDKVFELNQAPEVDFADADEIFFLAFPAKAIRLVVLDNYGGPYAGLSQIKFYGKESTSTSPTVAIEPDTWGPAIPLNASNIQDAEVDGAFNRHRLYAFNGRGLDGEAHDDEPSNMWLSVGPAEAIIDFGEEKTLDGVKIWNYNERDSGGQSKTGDGIKDFVIETGTLVDSEIVWSEEPVVASILARADGLPDYDNCNAYTLGVKTQYLRLTSVSSYDPVYGAGLSEVVFYERDFVDINHDGEINLVDFARMSVNWETSTVCDESNNWCDGSDITQDSYVNIDDMAELAIRWLGAEISVPSDGLITPVSGTLTDQNQDVSLAFDGSGLDGVGPVVDQTHSTAWNNIAQAAYNTAPTFTFDLGDLCDLDGVYIWNGNMDYNGDQTARGIQNFDLYVSSDSDPATATWTLVGNYTIAKAPYGPVSAEFVSFSATGVRQVKLDVQTNYGDGVCTTLSEIRFKESE